MAWKLLEQDFFVIFMERIIVILIPIILKVILEVNIDLCWIAKAIIKLSHYSEEPIQVIQILNGLIECKECINNLYEIIHNVCETSNSRDHDEAGQDPFIATLGMIVTETYGSYCGLSVVHADK